MVMRSLRLQVMRGNMLVLHKQIINLKSQPSNLNSQISNLKSQTSNLKSSNLSVFRSGNDFVLQLLGHIIEIVGVACDAHQ